jgi:hypothetical protein
MEELTEIIHLEVIVISREQLLHVSLHLLGVVNVSEPTEIFSIPCNAGE